MPQTGRSQGRGVVWQSLAAELPRFPPWRGPPVRKAALRDAGVEAERDRVLPAKRCRPPTGWRSEDRMP